MIFQMLTSAMVSRGTCLVSQLRCNALTTRLPTIQHTARLSTSSLLCDTDEGPVIKGAVYKKFPSKQQCQKGKKYAWCSCGYSKKQPFCDGSHRTPDFNTSLKPIRWEAPTSTP